jgi:asparagine synthase (glutamine-hydrolysing)
MPKGLFALADVPRVLNRAKLVDVLLEERRNFEATLYAGVLRLNPAHVTKIDGAGTVTKKQYWGEGNIAPVRLGSNQAYAEAMREKLDAAVRRQLRTVHKVGCFLSGGLDSSSVAALAARALASQGKRLQAYTQVPSPAFTSAISPRRYFDERPYVEAIREMIGNLDVTYVCSGEQDDFAELDRFSQAIDNPPRNVTNLGWILQIYRTARDAGQRVLLGGDLGNMTISWEGWDQVIDHVRQFRLGTAWKQMRLHYEITPRSRLGGIRRLFLEPAGIDLRRALKLSHQRHSPINPKFAASFKADRRPARLARSLSLAARLDLMIRIELRGEVEAGILALHGVDGRDPTADLDVIEFCLGIPPEQYLAERIDRSLVRRAMWGLLPGAVLTNRKRGLQAADWLSKMKRSSGAIAHKLDALRKSELASEVLDLDRLGKSADDLDNVTSALNSRVIDEYLIATPKALAIASFLKIFETEDG